MMANTNKQPVYSYTDWTFSDVSTKEYTHAIHPYPARMHPEIPKRLIQKWAQCKTDVVLDPFAGSGGTLLESVLNGNPAVGIDVNPFAVLLSRVKTTLIHEDLVYELNALIEQIRQDCARGTYHTEMYPDGIDQRWYCPDTTEILTCIKYHILKISNEALRNFFKVCFALAERKVSYQRNGSWKLHRMSAADMRKFNPDPIGIFERIVQGNIPKMMDLVAANPKGRAHVMVGDSRNLQNVLGGVDEGVLDDGKVHLVVTSPPYGDHPTTMAYGQFSKHPGLWLDLPEEEVLSVDTVGLGGGAPVMKLI